MLALAVLSFLAVFGVIMAAAYWLYLRSESPAAELKRRLRKMANDASKPEMPSDLREELRQESSLYEKFVSGLPGYHKISRYLERAGLQIDAEKYVASVFCLLFLTYLLTYLFRKSHLFSLIMVTSVVVAGILYLQYLIAQRCNKFTEQLPDALSMLSRSLRAGHSLTSALELVGNEVPEPLGGFFKTAYEQQKYGLRTTEALANILLKMESLDLRFFVMIIAINSEIGGNLSEILDKLATTIRERFKLRRQIRVLTAQGRMSGYVLAVLPIITFVALQYMLMPGYEDVFLNDPKGQKLIALAVCCQIIGYLVIRKIINVRI